MQSLTIMTTVQQEKGKTMSKNESYGHIYVPEEFIEELKQKADDAEYFRGRVDGMEYVIDSLENAFKGEDNE